MLFTSLQYLVFLPVIVLLFWVLPRGWRLPMLLVASYYFYASFIWQFLALILPMTLFNWLWGKLLVKDHSNKKILGVGIAVNLFILAVFKYANFFARFSGRHLSPGGCGEPALDLQHNLASGHFFLYFRVHPLLI